MTRLARTLLIAITALGLGCNLIPKQTNIEIEQTVDALNRGIDALARESADWRSVLEGVLADIPDELQSTVRIELTELISRTIAVAGSEFRCDLDFLRARLRQDLERIRDELLGLDPQVAREPVLCSAVPTAVDLNAEEFRRNRIDYFGYDLQSEPITALIYDRFGAARNVSQHLHLITDYQMSLNLATEAVQLSEDDRAIALSWGGTTQSSIPVSPSGPVSCETETRNLAPGQHDYIPPHTRGDQDFKGHGPRVNSTVTLSLNPARTRLSGEIYMRAREWDGGPKKDYTTAKGSSASFDLYDATLEPEPGWTIKSFDVSSSSSKSYTDTNHEDDVFNSGGNQPVEVWRFVGDTKGKEAGTRTKVKVKLRPIKVTIEKCPQ